MSRCWLPTAMAASARPFLREPCTERPRRRAHSSFRFICTRGIAPALAPGAVRITFMPNDVFAIFDTTEGTFKARLFADRAPKTVENFVSLAEGGKTGKPFYDGLVF